MKKRTITLLASQTKAKIDPAEWLIVSQAKVYDDTSTKILRLFRHRARPEQLMAYGMGQVGGKVIEAYDLPVLPELAPAVLEVVAKHCGVVELLEQVKA